MANPNPTPPPKDKQWKPGQSGNPAGRPKGIKSFANIVRVVLADENLVDKVTNSKNQKWLAMLPEKNVANAVVVAMVVKALEGDAHAADWLRKTGYGDKLDITTDGHELPVPILGGASMAVINTKPKPTAAPAPAKAPAVIAPNKVALRPVATPVAQPGTKPPAVNTNKPQGSPAPTTNKPPAPAQQPARPQPPRTVTSPVPTQPPKLSPAQIESNRIIASAIVPPTNGK